jgi:hypothetical protein
MPKISFEDEKPYLVGPLKSNAWIKISKQLLNYCAPQDAVLLLPHNKV